MSCCQSRTWWLFFCWGWTGCEHLWTHFSPPQAFYLIGQINTSFQECARNRQCSANICFISIFIYFLSKSISLFSGMRTGQSEVLKKGGEYHKLLFCVFTRKWSFFDVQFCRSAVLPFSDVHIPLSALTNVCRYSFKDAYSPNNLRQ